MSNPLLLFLDFDELAEVILETSNFLLTHIYSERKAILFHIIEEALTSPAYILPYLKFEFKKIKEELNKLIEKTKLEKGKIEKSLAFGDRWANLEWFLHNLTPELAIIGYKPHLIKVPLAEKLLERLELTFLTVKEKPLVNLKKIACFFDQSQDAIFALRLGVDWAVKTEAKILVLNLYFAKSLATTHEINLREAIKTEITQTIQREVSQADKVIEDILVFKIDSLQELDRFLSEDFDVIFVGRKGETLIKGLGSFSKHMLRMSEIPVCIVKG